MIKGIMVSELMWGQHFLNNIKLKVPEEILSASVIGAARSGVAAAKLLNKKGISVFLSDNNNRENIREKFINEIERENIRHEFGIHSSKIYENDVIVISPGVPDNSEVIKTAMHKNIRIVSEIEAGYWYCKGKIISITGTNGKTTTTTLTGEIFRCAGRETFVCGNIGTAFCDVADLISEDGVAVLETSSFQLDHITRFKPHVSVLLNITPDHLDRYDNDMFKYMKSKFRVFENQGSENYFVFNFDDNLLRENIPQDIRAKIIPFSIHRDLSAIFQDCAYVSDGMLTFIGKGKTEKFFKLQDLQLKGEHNICNALASAITARIFGIEAEIISCTLAEFKGVEHRLEFVRELNGVKYYNDSKATNVNSVWYALRGFQEPVILILGGKDKGNNYDEILYEVKNHVKHIIAIGSSKIKVYEYFKNFVSVTLAEDMNEAVNACYSISGKGESVLLSPACASFDMFEDYEHRGRVFKELVNNLK